MKRVILFLFMVLMALTGCNNQNAEGLYDLEQDADGARLLSNPTDEDDYRMGRTMSDQNPNLPNIDGNGVDQAEDVEQAREVIEQLDGFEPGAVWINGQDMWVTAYKKGMQSNEEKIDTEAMLHKKLLKALPRYHIEVQVREDRR
ncbi:hypothetical protein LS684_19385 [Cytobacillus spongiae]|jgi:uncharacterized lipoprotein NlpE involved in copper resistance|uniref:hypothetical protein n=1 Tax=Cytobacillus spongiae TaxID=2901381 RepID=UPI001F30D695|nr:hypothetical protein [Cytobacillus spongiae]UII55761.1 hypothetical protein LS684_19385 [Cytobacillus spongiae]